MGQEVRTKKSNTSGVNAVLIGNDFPELGADLVAALAALDVNNLTHSAEERGDEFKNKNRSRACGWDGRNSTGKRTT